MMERLSLVVSGLGLAAAGVLGLAAAGCAHGGGGASDPSRVTALPPASAAWAGTPKIGRCTRLTKVQEALLPESKAAGYDYVELSVQILAELSDEEFAEAESFIKGVGLPTPVANGFIPPEIKLVGPDIDEGKQMAYVTKAFDRAARLGIKVIGFGSGPAREVPAGFDMDRAFAQLVDFARRIAPEAQKRDITLGVEPMRRGSTNIINTAEEGLRWVKAVDHPNFQLMIDYFHFAKEDGDPDFLLTAKDHIVHIHFANPGDPSNRGVYPKSLDEYPYGKFFENLRAIGYRGGVSVEAVERDWESEAAPALTFLREQLGQARAGR